MTFKSGFACIFLTLLTYEPLTGKNQKSEQATPKKTKKVKIKKEKLVYPYPNKLLKNMDEKELEETLIYAKKAFDKELAMKAFFLLISQCKDQENLKRYKLDVGDYFFDLQDYEKATMAYEEFSILFPGSDESEYAQYKTILSLFYLSLDYDRDQSGTQKTVSLCLLFLAKAKNEKFIKEVTNIHQTLRRRLFDHEIYVFETYLKLMKFKSAKKRLEFIEEMFHDIPHFEEYISYCKDMLAFFEDKKTRPFYIQLNIENALLKKQDRPKPASWRHVTSFFLG